MFPGRPDAGWALWLPTPSGAHSAVYAAKTEQAARNALLGAVRDWLRAAALTDAGAHPEPCLTENRP